MSDSSDEEAAAMALAMGFSSFGAPPSKKKRKFNSATDAFVDGQEQLTPEQLENIDRGGKKGKGSGGNNVALGRTRVFGTGSGSGAASGAGRGGGSGGVSYEAQAPLVLQAHARNDAEINLYGGRADDGSGDEEKPNYVDTSLPAPVEELRGIGSGGEGSLELQNQATEKATEAVDEMQAKIDSILASAQPGISVPPLPALPPGYTDSAFTEGRIRSPPAAAVQSVAGSSRGGGGGGMRGGRGGGSARGGQRNERWWEGYYDPSFNVNPWEALEKKMELRSVGNWLEKGHWDLNAGVRVPTTTSAT
ncbi:hypothetical protein LSUB1_G002944 [Lachnellula subtilissima]|uniref:Uncharacterized protein n=1 Tax=Lachnellula subtilissima TaxID=602034 RepID=A0A8H8RK44_9HELO|nr:hypothetical protein LSUB1_G002944 [Lachnellula subtilissima]